MFVLFISLSSPCWADLSNKGLDVQEEIHFSSADKCQNTVTTAMNNTGFTVEKAEKYEQGPTIWGVSRDRTHKSMTKCMLRYNLVITFVIGRQNNLTAAENLNKEIKRLVAGGETGTNWGPYSKDNSETMDDGNYCEEYFAEWYNFISFPAVRKIETPRGSLILKAPTRNAEVVKRSSDPSLFVIGYINTGEGKFYVTKYSCERYETGKDPWYYLLR
jgi:hypothetical protein